MKRMTTRGRLYLTAVLLAVAGCFCHGLWRAVLTTAGCFTAWVGLLVWHKTPKEERERLTAWQMKITYALPQTLTLLALVALFS